MHARPQEFLAGAQFLLQPIRAVTGEKVENFLSDRQAVHPGKRLGIGAQLRGIVRGALLQPIGRFVGLEINEDNAVRFQPEAVDHALQHHLLARSLPDIFSRIGQDGELELAPERFCLQDPRALPESDF